MRESLEQGCTIQMESKGESESNILIKCNELERNASTAESSVGVNKSHNVVNEQSTLTTEQFSPLRDSFFLSFLSFV